MAFGFVLLGDSCGQTGGPCGAEELRIADAAVPTDSAATTDEVIETQLQRDLRFLTDDALAGRSSVEDPIDLAADYLQQRLADAGLRVDTFGQTARQSVPIPLPARLDEHGENRLTLRSGGVEISTLRPGERFMPMAIGRPVDSVTGPLVFAGYGITAPEYGYDDYERIDAEGKFVIVLRKEPGPSDEASPFEGKQNTRHAYFETKVQRAVDAGAAGLLIVNDAESIRRTTQRLQRRIDQEIERLTGLRADREALPDAAENVRENLNELEVSITSVLEGLRTDQADAAEGLLDLGGAGQAVARGQNGREIPVASIGRTLADEMLRLGGVTESIEQLERRINQSYAPASESLSAVEATLAVTLRTRNESSDNVIAYLPGRGALAGESIVVGAHYDHVGMGGPGSLAAGTFEVHNGADDNASGTAVMVAAAGQIADQLDAVPHHRRVIFIAFTGEERGLLGSEYYVDHPRWPIDSTAAMINLDMVGRLKDNDLTVYGSGTSPTFDDLLDRLNDDAGFGLTRVPGGYGPSDHASFCSAGVPVLFYFTGLHRDYHRPSDDFERLNIDGMVRITRLVTATAVELATIDPRPEFTEDTSPIEIRRQR